MIEGLRLQGLRLGLKRSSSTSGWHEGQLTAALNRDAGAYLDESLKITLAATSASSASSLPAERILEDSILGYVAALYIGNLASN